MDGVNGYDGVHGWLAALLFEHRWHLSNASLLGLLLLARWTVGREWRVPWAIVTGTERLVCFTLGHRDTHLADRTWCARCGRQRRQPSKAAR